MKKEFEIHDEWVSFEIHPETPKEGVLLSQRFKGEEMERMARGLNRSGAPYGIEFGEMKLLSNSRMALEASEYARDRGKFDDFHEKIFHAYFTEGKDIGNLDVILAVGESAGLDKGSLKSALEEGKYLNKLENGASGAEDQDINSTPTFIINDRYSIIGAQPIESFRRALNNIK